MKIDIIVLASLLMASIAGISVAVSTSGSSGSDPTFDQVMADLENGSLIADLVIGRQAGRAEVTGKASGETTTQQREAISDYNKHLKKICNESSYNELKIKYPGANPTREGDLVDEYGDYVGPGVSYDGDPLFHNDTKAMYAGVGRIAGYAEITGQLVEASYYGNSTDKMDYGTFAGTITQCNIAIRDYNKLLKTHCDESHYEYDELKIEEFRI
jgi:hypothetical protein